MSAHIPPGEKMAKLVISGEFTIYTIGRIKDSLVKAMLTCDNIEVDLSEVTEVDTVGVQLMLIAKRNPGKKVVFVNHPPAVLRLIDLACLGRTLGDLPVVDAARA